MMGTKQLHVAIWLSGFVVGLCVAGVIYEIVQVVAQ